MILTATSFPVIVTMFPVRHLCGSQAQAKSKELKNAPSAIMQFLAIKHGLLMLQQLGHLVLALQQSIRVVPYGHLPCKTRNTASALLNSPTCHKQTGY
jgi:hypothetical protein